MEEVHKKLGNLLLKGWTMLGTSCPKCLETPLMRSKDKKIYCGKCDIYVSQDMKSIEANNNEVKIDDNTINNDNSNKKFEFNPYNNLSKITNIPMSDDTIHKPDWNPNKYFNKINPRLLDTTLDIISKRLEIYINLLENSSFDLFDMAKESQLISLIDTSVSLLERLPNLNRNNIKI